MRATLTALAVPELELSASAGEWLSLADVLDAGAGRVVCETGEPVSPGESRLRALAVRPAAGPQVRIGADSRAGEAFVEGTPAGLAQMARLVREFAAKSRRGQADPIENRGPDHFIHPASILTILHLGGEAAARKGDVGG
ncbi:MAG: hypothetical protein IT452_15595 [Planctomycetia bacterium]|nr:hypothetical protein [Planctomycetia bacterium]